MQTKLFLASFVAPLFLNPPAFANDPSDPDEIPEAPIARVLASLSEDVRVFNEHLTVLASPFMEGRLPGTRGMEIATEYVEHYLRAAGLQPAFADELGAPTFRQPFPLSGVPELVAQSLAIAGDSGFAADEDYTALSLGAAGSVTGPAVFVGYSIAGREGDYASYADGDDLTGKIAVMFRFEPMDAEGKSKWAERGWSRHAGFRGKLRAAAERGAAGIVIVNPPGASDERSKSLSSFSTGGSDADVPVFLLMPGAGARLFGGEDAMMAKRHMADEAGGPMVDLGVSVSLACDIETEDVVAENVAGFLPGRGELADELIVIGAHMDHLGMGFFGSRDRENAGKKLHPGADDNASGTAGIMLIADWLVDAYAELPEDQPLRSVLFIAFSAEESGLNGARYYVEHPIVPLEKHTLMMNFDMIGRITNKRLTVAGVGTAKGLSDLVEPIFARSPLDVQPAFSGGGGSDHLAFLSEKVPSLFGILADIGDHADFHTPNDTSDRINRVDAVEASYLWRDIALVVAQHADSFEYVDQGSGGGPGRGNVKVRFGVRPGNYDKGLAGIPIASVTSGGAAEAGGVLGGDRLVSWDGAEVTDVSSWMALLAKHEPGDAVIVGVERGGELLELRCVLQAPGDR
jgi:hypothetical protein